MDGAEFLDGGEAVVDMGGICGEVEGGMDILGGKGEGVERVVIGE